MRAGDLPCGDYIFAKVFMDRYELLLNLFGNQYDFLGHLLSYQLTPSL